MESLLAIDRDLFLAINHGLGSSVLDPVFLAISYLGHGLTIAVVALPLLFLWDRPRFWRVTLLVVVALLFGGLLVQLLKLGVARPRPLDDPELAKFGVRAVFSMTQRSFPSGHAQTVAGAAVLFGLLYRRLLLPLIGVALLVGLSRIYLGVHFPADVLAGFAIGAAVSAAVWVLAADRLGLTSTPDSATAAEAGEPHGQAPE